MYPTLRADHVGRATSAIGAVEKRISARVREVTQVFAPALAERIGGRTALESALKDTPRDSAL